jgi:hypothetical protein
VVVYGLALCVGWTAPQITVAPSSGPPAGSATVPINLSGNTVGVGVQLDVKYDGGTLSLGTPTGGSALSTQLVTSSQLTNGMVRIVIYSLGNTLLGNGTLVNLPFNISPGAVAGPINIGLTNVMMADAGANSLTPVLLQPGALNVSFGAGARLGGFTRGSNGRVQFQLTATPDQKFVIQTSFDLIQWYNLSTNVVFGGMINLTDTPATNYPSQFYRALYSP